MHIFWNFISDVIIHPKSLTKIPLEPFDYLKSHDNNYIIKMLRQNSKIGLIINNEL